MSQQRRIKLQKQEYSFPFNNPSGARVKCTVIDGAGTVTLYEVKTTDMQVEEHMQVGDPQFLSVDPGNVFYVSLNTAKRNSRWEIVFRGKGVFELELPDQLLSRYKYGRRTNLSKSKYDTKGIISINWGMSRKKLDTPRNKEKRVNSRQHV